jgi:CheY-like chemotaxis protein
MSAKRALIVDDSKTAQLRLRKLLEHYALQIDLAGSAEEALSYLSYRSPAVIFLDHLMPGMDGFEALKVIKANPHTATIPVVMYTSKSGDLYLGQARALGAIDVISKDVIEPSNIEKVMNAINVMPKSAVADEEQKAVESHHYENIVSPVEQAALPERRPVETLHRDGPVETAPPEAVKPLEDNIPVQIHSPVQGTDFEGIKRHLSRSLEMNIIKIRQEVSDQNRFLFKRIMRELKDIKTSKEPPPQRAEPPRPAVAEPPPRPEEKSRSIIPDLLIIAVLVFIGYQANSILNLQENNQLQIHNLQSSLDEKTARPPTGSDRSPTVSFSAHTATTKKLFAALEWSMNLNNQFDYGELALNDERLVVIQELVSRLHGAEFNGVILLSVNHGDFCVLPTSNGELVLPKADTPVQNCQMLSQQNTEYALQDQMSLGFVNFLLSSPLLSDEGIQIDLASHGMTRPKFSYPEPTVSAGRWNQVARMNNRVDVELIPRHRNLKQL